VTVVLQAPRLEPQASLRVTADVSGAEWDSYVSRHPDATVDHLSCWREIFERVFGHRSVYLAARRGDTIAGVLPLVLFRSRLFGRSIVSMPFLNYGGLVTNDVEATGTLVNRANELAREFGASHVELRHRSRQLEGLPYRQHKLAFVRALPSTVEDLWKDTDRKVRNQVRKAQKEGLVVQEGGKELVEDFYSVFSRNMRDLGTPVYPRRLFTETLGFLSANASVFVVRLDKRPLAAAIAIRFRDSVIVPWASSLREFRHLSANTLLYWSMLERATTTGSRTFDFGRSSPGGGTQQFKLQWGAAESPLFWEYPHLSGTDVPDHSPTNPRFQAAVAVWKRCPLWFTNTVGPHVVRAIP